MNMHNEEGALRSECGSCFRHCRLSPGETGFCLARAADEDGNIKALYYGKISSLSLDPIEKKPLMRFYPKSNILSVGFYGCNMRCPFCQNHEISYETIEGRCPVPDACFRYIMPDELCSAAAKLKSRNNIGVAYTYNEPLTSWEYVRDCARLVSENNMKNVLVSNGTASYDVLSEILPYMDAMNIDLKSFNKDIYKKLLKGDLDAVKDFISHAAGRTHLEITTLVVTDMNDSSEEIEDIANFIASLPNGREIPLHLSRFFPGFDMTDRKATDVRKIYALADIARRHLKYVYTGNC
mgnify:CR=1 FL=1